MGTVLLTGGSGYVGSHIALNLLKKNIWPEFESGKIDIKIFQEFNLEDVEKAHKIMENSNHFGKLVLVVNE